MPKNILFAVFIGFLIIIEAFIYWPKFAELKIASDASEYQELAANLLNGKGFYLEADGGATMLREPGYPFFLFLIYKIFGVKPDAGRVTQVILLLLICFLVYKIYPSKIAVLAVVFHPLFVIYSGEIISEMLAAFLIVLFCFVLIKSFESEKGWLSFLAGLILGALVLTKSIFIFIPIFILPAYWFLAKDKKIVKIMLFALSFIILVSPWLYRNHLYFQRWAIAERSGEVAYVHASKSYFTIQQFKNYTISSFLSQYFVRLKDDSFNFFSVAVEPMNKRITNLREAGYSRDQIDRLLIGESGNLWLNYPLKNFLIGFAELAKANSPTVPRNSIVFVYDISGLAWWKFAKGAVIIFIRLAWLAVLFVVGYGCLEAVRRKMYFLFPLIMLIIYLNGVIFFLEGMPRFIFPIYSLYFIFFSIGLSGLLFKLKIRIFV